MLDHAFKSRIHLVLHFSQFDEQSTHKIWNQVLDRLRAEESGIRFSEDRILDFIRQSYEENELRLNGREINNLVANALALAQADARRQAADSDQTSESKKILPVRLDVKHIRAAAQSGQSFDSYLQEIRGHDSMLRAQQDTFEMPRANASQRFVPRKTKGLVISSDSEDTRSDVDADELELQELELQLKIARLKRQQKKKQRATQQWMPHTSMASAGGGAAKTSDPSRRDDYDDSE